MFMCKLADAENAYDRLFAKSEEMQENCDTVELDEDTRVEISSGGIYVKQFDLFLRFGVVLVYDEYTCSYEPDESVVVFYHGQKPNKNDWEIYQQGNLIQVLNDYLWDQNADVNDLDCEVIEGL